MPAFNRLSLRCLAVIDAPLVLAIHVGVRLVGLARIQGVLWRVPTGSAPPPASIPLVVEQTRLRVRFVKRRLPWCGNCLSRSLATWLILRRHGIDSALRIGATMKDDTFRAHAWIEHDGQPVNAGPKIGQRYIEFEEDFASRVHWTR